MNIQDATKMAMQEGKAIQRKSDNSVGAILPSNLTRYQCLIVSNIYKSKGQIAHARWQPSADDLLADDWELKD
ncbi:MW1434 family type I TA system toxin [Mammaliicoccus sciuri]|uniref:Thoeris anti-defense Tad2 family protein n=1 Tax=Mammaliicoccus sciuri TaxID=1296 RepID=UPI002B25C60A|nr:MW1434 family type I TA system toxin [Mammaliicoccus sciuri]WQJ66630.1 MW1434 family type I TA system toxin [Mammaliicoccus sciuri]